MKLQVYSKSGTAKYKINNLTYSGTHMGKCACSVDFLSPSPINFEIGDWFKYRDDIFTLYNIPSVRKKGAKDAYGGSFEYKSVTYNSTIDELAECPFCDYVADDSDVKFTAMPSFSFLASTIQDLADRIQVNLDKMYGTGVWSISVNSDYSDERNENKLITVSNQKVWDVLALVSSEYDQHFIVRGRTITLCTNGVLRDLSFLYGKGKGCYEMERVSNQDQKIITRLNAYGNTKNIVARYYSTIGADVRSRATRVYATESTTRLFVRFHNQDALYTQITFIASGFEYEAKFIDGEQLQEGYIGNVYEITSGSNTRLKSYLVGSNQATETTPDYSVFDELQNNEVIVKEGVNKSALSQDDLILDSTINFPNNLNVNNLMLPAFPKQTLAAWVAENKSKYDWLAQAVADGYTFSSEKFNPYIKSKNYTELGNHPHYEYFTKDDVDHKDIYPSVEMWDELGDENKILSATEEDGSEITSSGIYPPIEYSTIPRFIINIGELGFDFADVKIKDTNPKITFQDGACGSRTFEILAYHKKSFGWELVCNRVYDDSIKLYFPYGGGKMETDDKFILTDINMPESYVDAASVVLLKWAIAWLRKNDYTVYNYKLSPDEIYIQRHDDAVISGGGQEKDTFHYKIKEGDYLFVKDADLGFEGNITIQTLTIKEGEGLLPTYEIVLSDVQNVGTIKKMQNQINGLSFSVQNIGNVGGSSVNILRSGDNDQPSESNVLSAQRSMDTFLRKDADDEANGNITFNKDIAVKGTAYTDTIENSDGITTKDLVVTGSAHFFELVIDKVRATQGMQIQSPANAKIDAVERSGAKYKLFFLATDSNGKTITNDFMVGDQIFMQTFNLDASVQRFYWVLCTQVGQSVCTQTITIDGKEVTNEYHYIEVDFANAASNCNSTPKAGDEIVVLGHQGVGSGTNILAEVRSITVPDVPEDEDDVVYIAEDGQINYEFKDVFDGDTDYAIGERASATIISSVASGFLGLTQTEANSLGEYPLLKAPMFVQLNNITSFSITHENNGNIISRGYNSFRGDFISKTTGENILTLVEGAVSKSELVQSDLNTKLGNVVYDAENKPIGFSGVASQVMDNKISAALKSEVEGKYASVETSVQKDANGNLTSNVHVTGDKLTIDTDNFSLDADGNVDVKGDITCSSLEYTQQGSLVKQDSLGRDYIHVQNESFVVVPSAIAFLRLPMLEDAHTREIIVFKSFDGLTNFEASATTLASTEVGRDDTAVDSGGGYEVAEEGNASAVIEEFQDKGTMLPDSGSLSISDVPRLTAFCDEEDDGNAVIICRSNSEDWQVCQTAELEGVGYKFLGYRPQGCWTTYWTIQSYNSMVHHRI